MSCIYNFFSKYLLSVAGMFEMMGLRYDVFIYVFFYNQCHRAFLGNTDLNQFHGGRFEQKSESGHFWLVVQTV